MLSPAGLWLRLPSLLGVRFMQRLSANFGWRFVVLIASTYFGVKGLVHNVAKAAFLPYMRYKVGVTDASRYQALYTASRLPWSLKPLIGMISDVLPIGGYYKRWYIQGAVLVGSAACAVLAAAPVERAPGGAIIAAVLLFFVNVDTASSDLLVEGIYSEKMVQNPDSGADMVTMVWGCQQAATFFGSLLIAFIASGDASVFFWVCLPFAAQLALPVAAGWVGEARTEPGFRRDKVVAHARYFFLGFMMAAGVLGLGAASLWASVEVQAAYSVGISILLCGLSLWLLPPMLGKAQVYKFASSALNLSIKGALDPFYTGTAACNPGGPQFDLPFFLSWSAALGSVAGLLGVVIFQKVLSRTFYRRAFWTTTVLQVASAIVDIAIVQRWNIRAGISDKLFYLLGDSIVVEVVDMMDFMPEIVLISKLCPPGMESSVYALLAGFSNFGNSVASSVGALAIAKFGIHTPRDGSRCNFDNLTWLIIVSHIILPLLTVPLTFLLIPNARMTDDLIAMAAAAEVTGGAARDKDATGEPSEGDESYGEGDGTSTDEGGGGGVDVTSTDEGGGGASTSRRRRRRLRCRRRR